MRDPSQPEPGVLGDPHDRLASLLSAGSFRAAGALVAGQLTDDDERQRLGLGLLQRCARLSSARGRIEEALQELRRDELAAVEELLALVGMDRDFRPESPTEPGAGPESGDGAMPAPTPTTDHCAGPVLDICFLGPFRVRFGRREIVTGRREKAMELLRFLAAQPTAGIHKDQLAERFWPGAGERSARRSLHQAIYTVRRVLAVEGAAEQLRFDDDRYSFGDDHRVRDIDRLEELVARARSLACGEGYGSDGRRGNGSTPPVPDRERHPLAEVCEEGRRLYTDHFLVQHPYDEWATGLRQRCAAQHRELMSHLFDLLWVDRSYHEIVGLADRMLGLDQGDEVACRHLMRAQLALGRPESALAVYQVQAEFLNSELGVDPGPESTEIAKLIRGDSNQIGVAGHSLRNK